MGSRGGCMMKSRFLDRKKIAKLLLPEEVSGRLTVRRSALGADHLEA
jgi:hypothetical protein